MSAFRRPTAVGRLLRVPGLVLFVILLHLLPQVLSGSRTASAIDRALGRYSLPETTGFLGGLIETLRAHPTVVPSQMSFAVLATLGTLLAWFLLLAGVIRRLASADSGSADSGSAGAGGGAAVLANGWRGFPRILVVTLWHWPARLLVVGVPWFLASKVLEGPAKAAALVAALLAFFYCTCALDLARCRAVFGRARPYRPGVALGAFAEALRRPAVLVPSVLLSLAQWACALGTLGVGIGYLEGAGTIWAVRGLAMLAVVFGLLRLSVAVGATTGPRAVR